ncbi:uncharacterized protein RAG0_03015 [Rhynchosporium agropyri]|uniref:non-specific serine/threonine protein kinase n=1 Tax=Rhynchosporium agropyri TaxID=914238 RepID=A0A1E1K3L2_9HELO|nr:uncharacterized protein RAG0_03015 [Rhynchosporium agropyri]
MQYRDLSKAVLSLQPRSVEANMSLNIPFNYPFITQEKNEIKPIKRTDRDATPHLAPSTVKITVQTDKIPRNKHGWIFGSDPQICDYLLDADKSHGVSGGHFEIYYNWESMVLMIRNLSHNRLGMEADEGLEIIEHTRALCQADCHISVGLLTFHLEIPEHGELLPLYIKNLEIHRNTLATVPELSSLAVKQRGIVTPAVYKFLATATSTSTSKYIRRHKLGTGASGSVYNGIGKTSGNEVALKEFRNKRKAEEISVEIKILRSLRHAHIVRYIDFVTDPEPLLVMELISGGNLATLQDVSLHETLKLGQQTIQGVSYLHDNEITHRDIKPANILIVSRGHHFKCKLADFGESSVNSSLDTYCGTSMYQAPEVLNPPYSNAVDIWSLGIILVEYWYDWYPNELPTPSRDSWFRTRRVQASSELQRFWKARPEEENSPMAQILLQMLQLDPEERIKASVCRTCLDGITLPDESRPCQELRLSRKRNSEQAGHGNPSASRNTSRNPHQMVAETSRPVLPTIVESLDIERSVHQPQFSETTSISGSVRLENSSPKTCFEITEELAASRYLGEQIIRLDQQMKRINASDILKAACKGTASRLLLRYTRYSTSKGTQISYKEGEALLRLLNLSQSSIQSVIQAMEKGQAQLVVPKERARPQYEQVWGIIRLDPEAATMNAADLIGVAGVPKRFEAGLRKNFFTSHTTIRAHGRMGTYVSNKEGLKLCGYLALPRGLIEKAIAEQQKLTLEMRSTSCNRQQKRANRAKRSLGMTQPERAKVSEEPLDKRSGGPPGVGRKRQVEIDNEGYKDDKDDEEVHEDEPLKRIKHNAATGFFDRTNPPNLPVQLFLLSDSQQYLIQLFEPRYTLSPLSTVCHDVSSFG